LKNEKNNVIHMSLDRSRPKKKTITK